MKLYKFRPLGNCTDFERIEEIIEEEKFWCSRIWDLNDPMEGVYKNSFFNENKSNEVFTDKNKYLICSFSGDKGFRNPILWGYYANGFRGIAIEIEVSDNNDDIYQIEYVTQTKFRKNLDNAKKIITRKLTNWKHEGEYRFLIISDIHPQKIGNINKIFFGNPYGGLVNTENIIHTSKSLKKYYAYKDKLIKICNTKGIDYGVYIN